MKSGIFSFLLLSVLFSCSNNSADMSSADSADTSNNQKIKATSDLSGCYLRVLKRDTLALNLQQTGDSLNGKLTFDNFEKDGSTGSVAGTIDNNILKLTYNFQSEGMQSVMDVYFKIVDDGLIHGIGDVAVKSDTAYFTRPDEINYTEVNKLAKVPCEQLDPKYK